MHIYTKIQFMDLTVSYGEVQSTCACLLVIRYQELFESLALQSETLQVFSTVSYF